MLTMKFFNGLRKLINVSTAHDRDLRSWAQIEYKFDADYAYNTMKETGKAPGVAA